MINGILKNNIGSADALTHPAPTGYCVSAAKPASKMMSPANAGASAQSDIIDPYLLLIKNRYYRVHNPR